MEPISRASFSSSAGGSLDFESDLTLSDRLKAFKSSAFDPSAYFTTKCQTMNEKEIRHLCSYLVELKKASAEEMRKNVYANYASFIRTSKEISDLEGELLSMRNLLSTQAALVHHLADGILDDSLATNQEDPAEDDTFDHEITEQSRIDSWLSEFSDTLEVLLAEKRVDDALAALDEGEKVAEEASETNKLSPNTLLILQTAITEQRQKLADQLAETTGHTQGAELRSAILALKKLGDGPRAHTLLLNSHHQKLQRNMRSLRSSHTSYGGAYATALSQFVFSTIAQAANDSLAVFGEETTFASELVTWAVKQTESFALLLKRHVIASSALAGGLRVAAECLQMCLGHCSLLEVRGLALSPVILRHFRPTIQQALSNSLKRIEQSSAAVAAADDWLLNYLPGGMRHTGSTAILSTIGSQPKLSRSAHKFNSLVQEFVEDVWPIESLQLQFDGSILDGIWQVFDSYISLLVSALPGSVETEENLGGSANKIVRMAETETQQIALLANASLLAEELLPRGATKLLPLQQSNRVDMTPRRATERQNRNPEQREWKRRLQRSTDRLRDSFCRLHALELIFTEDGEARLNGQMYTYINGNAEEPEWFPSPIFQELFAKLTRVASIASDMFVGRERFATLLLMRLTETVILWLSNDQSFWEEIEEGPMPLGPLGLQQFYLDMEFVILFASQGRYLSRNLHQVIKNIIARVIEAVQATGIDPYRVLPEDEWFAEVAQIAIKMLSGKANFAGVGSPTASVSGKSMSSPISHGSN